jgi:hypothetical protein
VDVVVNAEREWTFSYSIPAHWAAVDPVGDRQATGALEAFAAAARARGAVAAAALIGWLESGIAVLGEWLAIAQRGSGSGVDAALVGLCGDLGRRRDGDITDRQVSVVDLPAGPAVRLRVVGDLVGGTGEATAVDSVQHWIPVPHEAGHDVLILAAGTPTLAAADPFAAAVDRIAGSLRIAAR